ncbi:MAG: type I-B CRISPR-associated protein Cas5b [Metasolibacillus sp.]|uniref:type I-B CRISPR-associated protein Cas5b n=1 Tax=Metasolibacillus sp. TaxID=2703680 RepID=UPI0025E3A133|nr:type I-B CRISPR-associated protein Cas5b [Metasolibacillus sp.]MCT6942540.1 type I-B CRISPR-associated protein Cas5b [Metasolibacillus sp.]
MKLLRLKLFQETACYLKPFSFKVGETFPLAPFSTVNGMLHAVLEATEYIPMKLSIQGKAESFIVDYQKKFMYKKAEVPPIVTLDGLQEQVEYDSKLFSTMPMYQHLLYNVEHIIHIDAEEHILQQLHEKLYNLNTALSLGRWEDLVRIDEVDFVDVEEKDLEEIPYNQYVPIKQLDDIFGKVQGHPYYRLPCKYTAYDGRREWDYVLVAHVPNGEALESNVLSDRDDYPVFLMEG